MESVIGCIHIFSEKLLLFFVRGTNVSINNTLRSVVQNPGKDNKNSAEGWFLKRDISGGVSDLLYWWPRWKRMPRGTTYRFDSYL